MTPAMIATWLSRHRARAAGGWLAAGWFHAKLVLVLAMTVIHGLFSHWAAEFAYDRNRHTPKFYRIVNEIPTLLLIVIVILATVKPF